MAASWASASGSPASAIGWAIAGCSTSRPDEAGLNGWVKIARDNSVIVAVPRAEMGQGIQTALAMLVAEEMDARWDQVRVEDPPENGVYRNVDILIDGLPFSPEETGTVVDVAHWVAGKLGGVLGVLATGGSTATRDAWLPMRTAGAVARELLLQAAGRKAGIPVADLIVSEGEVRRKDGTRVATFGELVDFVGDLSAMPAPPLKKPSEFKLIGKPQPRLDIPAKVAGTATFGIDVRLPGLLYAAVRNAPSFGGAATGFKVKGDLPKGVETVVIVPGGIAAIGSSWWRANKFLKEGLEVQWQPGPEPTLDSATLWKRYEELMATGKPALTRTLGSESKPAKTQTVEATYRAPYLAHTPMEPMNCTARQRKGRRRGLDAQPVADPDAAGCRQDRRHIAGPGHRAHDLPGRRLRPARRGRSRAPGRDLRARRAGAAGPGPVVARGGHPPRLLPADGAGALACRARRVGRDTEARERRQASGRPVADRPVSGARRSACRRRASPKAMPSRIRPTRFRSTSSTPSSPRARSRSASGARSAIRTRRSSTRVSSTSWRSP